MPPSLSWNEIRRRAIPFSHDWANATDKRTEAQSFWNAFFQVFCIKRRLALYVYAWLESAVITGTPHSPDIIHHKRRMKGSKRRMIYATEKR